MMADSSLDRAVVPGPGPLRPFQFPPVERMALSNGIPLLFARSAGFEVATMSVILDAGAIHEPAERAGLAGLTGSLLESGAGERSGIEIADELERLGLHFGIGTGWDAVQVEVTGLTSRMAAGVEVVADMLRQPMLPEPEVERLRGEQLAGILQRRAEPRSLANEMASRFLFAPDSPFSRSLSGSKTTLRSITRSDVVEFHRTRYAPRIAAVAMSGDLLADDALRMASAALGDWHDSATGTVRPMAAPRHQAPQLYIVDRPGAVQSEVRIGHVGVARDTDDFFAILVMNAILGGAFSSRLNMNLRERHGFTYGASSTFVMRRQPGPFLISTAVQTEVTAPALTEIIREASGIRESPVTGSELEDARNYLAGTFPLRLQTTDGVASRLAEMLIYNLADDYFDGYRDRIMSVQADQVLAAAERYIRPEQLTAVVVGDAGTIREPLEKLGFGPVEVVRADADA